MLKISVSSTFLRSSLRKLMLPLTIPVPTGGLFQPASINTGASFSTLPIRGSLISKSVIKQKYIRSSSSYSILSTARRAITLFCLTCFALSILSVSDAAPAKHTIAPKEVVNAMSFSMSDPNALPLQLRIEAQVAGKQKLAYLPTTGPSLDFYYLNYRPLYLAGESQIDFWMLTPQGSQPPKTASLELYDEFGKIRIATLVPEGTKVPQEEASKNQPFLWKSWKIPKTLNADFDFSEKFRIILKTSDSKPVEASQQQQVDNSGNNNNNNNNSMKKRFDSLLEFLVKGKTRHILDTSVTASGNDRFSLKASPQNSAVLSSNPKVMIVQDRQFRIKGLQASPGGKPNPAKVHVNRVASSDPAPASAPDPVPASAAGSSLTSVPSSDTKNNISNFSNINTINHNNDSNNNAKQSSAAKTGLCLDHAWTAAVLAVFYIAAFFEW
ncbi:hypothetical protein BX616_003850 [Lobosporangium transversale]|uniref:Uncharacterized protein n=1 Tax=Lobosporangium transversale TaxID=64571 RepID=A0A1Y2GPJ8_9FUNG|nr:hypothetical protein BCR41DRAFT_370346 [Lobosporangium transversale]KAF9916407.1 hypothetical protein BX616_003850 [Lobosporangium transversale]ORZ17536.1 hypothetical protein BCR41DRAFT_370346 [Lobosporangium transversale]|eukprot:XP_021881923.1 hypothetical protein BCR41DRAFT_370346 [Lobosporangium transversale]